MLVVDTGQQRVLDRAGAEVGLRLGIDRERVQRGLVQVDRAAHQRIAARHPAVAGAVEAGRVDAAVVHRAVRIAQVLPHRHGFVEPVLELIAHRRLLGVVAVEAGLADKQVIGDLAGRVGLQRAPPGEEADRGPAFIALEVGQQRERGVLARAPRQRRRDQVAVVLDVVHLRVAVARQRHQTVQPLAVRIEGAGQVGLHLLAVVVAELHPDLARRFRLRALADQVQDAADRALPEQHRRRPAQHVNAFQRIHIGPHVVVEADLVQQPVAILREIRAAELAPVATRIVAVRAGIDPGAVADGLLHAVRALRLHPVAGDDGDRLGRLHHRRVGLGGGGAAFCHEAMDRAGGSFVVAAGADRDGRQFSRSAGRCRRRHFAGLGKHAAGLQAQHKGGQRKAARGDKRGAGKARLRPLGRVEMHHSGIGR
ncbi:hypothetical protein D9M72_334640 [compost metagenome]